MGEVSTYPFRIKGKSSLGEDLSILAQFPHHSEKDHFFLTSYLGLPPLYEPPPDLQTTTGQNFENKREAGHRKDHVGWFLKTF